MQSAMTIAIPLLGAASAFLFALSLIPTKSPLALQLEALKSIPNDASDQSQLAIFEKMFSSEQRGRLSSRLMEAGWHDMTPAKIGLRVASSAGIGAILAILILRVVHLPLGMVVFLALSAAAAVAYLPFAILDRAITARKIAIQKALPDFLDMISTAVQAGLSVNAAMRYAAPGPLGDEIKEALSEMRLGRSRTQALKAAAARAGQQQFSTTIATITQAEKLGSSLANVLKELAEDTRHQRLMAVEEFAAKLPVKMVFPMAFFMLPCLFVIIFGSLIAHYIAMR